MNVMVTGGGGYIGAHAVRWLQRAGHFPVVLDSFDRGHRAAVPPGVPIVRCDVRETRAVLEALRRERIECVMHFAALAYVGESVEQPLAYYDNNLCGTLSLMRAVAEAEVSRVVFSSTCATYGQPDEMPIREDTPQQPVNPYGWSKLASEQVLRDYAAAQPGFCYAALRYFNVAGCARDGSAGEDHRPETHLIPLVLQVASGLRDQVTVFGDDYETPDGTCIRDYIHVDDLVRAHVMVMEGLRESDQRHYNLGIGRGYSVKEVVDAAGSVVGEPIAFEVGPRRPGDPPVLYADASRIERDLGWHAETTSIEAMIETAWRWHRAHPRGYPDDQGDLRGG